MKYIKKPIEIEAIQWEGNNHREMFNFLGGENENYMTAIGINFYIDFSKVEGGLVIKTLEGEHIATIGDYIIKGIKGEFYPCKPDIFEMTYELASTSSQTEISDEEIENVLRRKIGAEESFKKGFYDGAIWYREQIKKK
jgi:hypothetical protein